jgi:hypothetical protein
MGEHKKLEDKKIITIKELPPEEKSWERFTVTLESELYKIKPNVFKYVIQDIKGLARLNCGKIKEQFFFSDTMQNVGKMTKITNKSGKLVIRKNKTNERRITSHLKKTNEKQEKIN